MQWKLKVILGVYNLKLDVFVFIFALDTFNTILKQKKLQIKSSLKPCLTTTYDNYHLYNCEGLANTLFHAYACNFSNLNNTFLAQKTNLTGQNSGQMVSCFSNTLFWCSYTSFHMQFSIHLLKNFSFHFTVRFAK